MSNSAIISTKPYLLRAIFEWANDNGLTPQVLVNSQLDGVEVPEAHVVDGQIVLNIGLSAIKLHVMDNECVSFSARFNGAEQDIFLPMEAILAIFARENSRGIFFEDGHDLESDDNPEFDDLSESQTDSKSGSATKAKTRDSSHLKIIK